MNKMSKLQDTCCDIKISDCYDKDLYQASVERHKTKVSATATSAYYALKDAVVSIYCSTDAVVNDPDTEVPLVNETGSGFFIDVNTMVTCAHVVMFDNRLDNRSPAPTASPARQFARNGKIWARVSNVNRSGDSYFYECVLCAVAPQYDLAIIKIKSEQNPCVPVLKNHPVLGWGCSRSYAVGEPVYIIGDDLNSQAVGISQGIVVDNLYSDPLLDPTLDAENAYGFWPYEAVLTDAVSRYGNSGCPLIDANFRVVGVVSGIDSTYNDVSLSNYFESNPVNIPPGSWPHEMLVSNSTNRTVAVAEHVARYIVKVMLSGPDDCCTGKFLQYIQDPLGNYYRYEHGWLGITGFEAFGPKYLQIVPESYYQRQRGFIITGVQRDSAASSLFTNLYPYPPLDPNDPAPPTPTSELYLVTAITAHGGCKKMVPLGVDSGQIPFSSATYDKAPGCDVTISYRLGSEGFKCPYAARLVLGSVPLDLDMPPSYRQTVSSFNNRQLGLSPQERGVGEFVQSLSKKGTAFIKKLAELGPDVIKLLRLLMKNQQALEGLLLLAGQNSVNKINSLNNGLNKLDNALDKVDDVLLSAAAGLPAGLVQSSLHNASNITQKIDAVLEDTR